MSWFIAPKEAPYYDSVQLEHGYVRGEVNATTLHITARSQTFQQRMLSGSMQCCWFPPALLTLSITCISLGCTCPFAHEQTLAAAALALSTCCLPWWACFLMRRMHVYLSSACPSLHLPCAHRPSAVRRAACLCCRHAPHCVFPACAQAISSETGRVIDDFVLRKPAAFAPNITARNNFLASGFAPNYTAPFYEARPPPTAGPTPVP